MEIVIVIAKLLFVTTVLFLSVYAVRHYVLALSRLRIQHPRDTMEIVGFNMPSVTVMVPMHNEDRVAGDILQALVDCDYDWTKLQVIAINDRSTDLTAEIIDRFAAQHSFIHALHRKDGPTGKPAALRDAMEMSTGEIILLFDADYVPGRSILKMLLAPFSDPEIGAVMGRVVPQNVGESLLAGLLSLERAAGYQSSQQARYNLGFTAQFGGTVGGVRASALKAVGGWNVDSLTEDTDLTFGLLLRGWRVAYVNRAECYEEVPYAWAIRRRQLVRWVTGHTDCLHRYWREIARSKFISRNEKIDAVLLLALYWTAPVLVVGWLASLLLFFIEGAHSAPVLAIALSLLGYQLFGNQATFIEIGSAALLDGSRQRVLLMPLSLLNFFASTGTITSALMKYYWRKFWGTDGPNWYKTIRSRVGGRGSGFPRNQTGATRRILRGENGMYYMPDVDEDGEFGD